MATREELTKLLEKDLKKGGALSVGGSSKKKKKSTKYARDKDTRELQKSVNKQERKLGEEHKSSPSILSRVFDVLSRGNYAVAEGARSSKEAENKDKSVFNQIAAFGSGLGKGITGKKKTTFSDYFKEAAKADTPYGNIAKNKKVQGAGGLALDILADPTNAVGVGLVGKASKVEKGIDAASSAGKAVAAVRTSEKTKELARTAEITAKLEAKAAGATGKQVRNVGKKAKRAAIRDAVLEAGDAARNKALAREGAVSFNVFGVPVAKSKFAYTLGSKAVGKVGETGVGQWTRNAFSNAAHFPGMTMMFKRMYENRGVAAAEDMSKQIDELFKGTTKESRRTINHALESGTDLKGVLDPKSGRDLGEIQEAVRAHYDHMYNVEANEIGALAPEKVKLKGGKEEVVDKYNNRYVHHVYRGGTKAEQTGFKENRKIWKHAVGTESPGFAKKRDFKTLQDAKNAGLKPIEEADDALKLRIVKHQQVVARKQFVGSVLEQYGVKGIKKSDAAKYGLKQVDSEYLDEDVWFPTEIADTLKRMQEISASDEATRQALRYFDKAQSAWKFWATAMNPGHHFRNAAGDIYMNYLDGVTNPGRYYEAGKLLFGDSKKSFKIGKFKYSKERLYREYMESGAKSGFTRSEFGAKSGVSNLASATAGKVRNFAEGREDLARAAHFIDALKKRGKELKHEGDISALAQEVAHKNVNKFNLDYGALTPFERDKMKRIFPFYTFMRKNIPLQLEMLALKPGRVASIPKFERAVENLLGTSNDDLPGIAGTEIVPKWIKEMSAARVVEGKDATGEGSWFWQPPVPFMDIGRQAEGTFSEILANQASQTSPFLKILPELAMERQFFNQIPIKNKAEYLLNQLPVGRIGYRAFHEGEGINARKLTAPQLLNWLTGAGVHEITPQLQKSELRRIEDIIQAKRRKKKAEQEKRKKSRSNK